MAALSALLFMLIIACGTTARVSYDSYQVVRVTPSSEDQVRVLSRLADNDLIDVWSRARAPNSPWDIMVSPKALTGFFDTLNKVGLPWEVRIKDVGRTFRNEKSARVKSEDGRSVRADNFTHNKYLRYDEILKYIDSLAALGQKQGLNVSVETIGKSFENRSIRVLKIGATGVPAGAARRAVFIDGGIHAREWIAPAAVLFVADQLINNATASAGIIDDTDFYIVPVLNPDGYEHTHTNDRMWRKTRSNKNMIGFICNGVDANRNFGHHWREAGASWFPCSETYAGPKAFSEPETRALRDFLMAHKGDIKAYLTYHSYGNYLLYPWGYSNDLPEDHKWLESVAKQANAAMVAAGSRPYKIGSSSRVLYSAAGGSDDWAKAVAGIPLSYTIELPGGGTDGFNPPATSIVKTGRETLVGVFEFAKEVKKMKVYAVPVDQSPVNREHGRGTCIKNLLHWKTSLL